MKMETYKGGKETVCVLSEYKGVIDKETLEQLINLPNFEKLEGSHVNDELHFYYWTHNALNI